MRSCPKCDGRLVHCHRRSYEKLVYSEMFRCMRCDQRSGHVHPGLHQYAVLVLSLYSKCPRCYRSDVHTGNRADALDRTSGHALSRLQRRLGAPLKKCTACRLRYYDWRPVKSSPKPANPETARKSSDHS